MTYSPRPSDFVPCRESHAGVDVARRGILRRIYDAVFESQQKQAERVATAYLERSGGRFTDEIERRLIERLIFGEWRR